MLSSERYIRNATGARDHQRSVEVRIFFHSIKREQTETVGCLSQRQCGKERRTSLCVLLDRGSAI